MKELSLNILDIAENSVKAKATLTEIFLREEGTVLTLTIRDNGVGMTEEVVKKVTDPFYTSRKTRDVGMGLPLLEMEAMQTGGYLTIASKDEGTYPDDHGTTVTAVFHTDSIDFTPLGDVVSSIVTLIQGHPNTDFCFEHDKENQQVRLDTREMREILGPVPLNTFDVITWIQEYLTEQYEAK